MAWFSLNPSGNPTQPNNYTLQSSQPSCSGEDQICALQANNNGSGQPVITDALKNEMIVALHSRTPSANVSLKDA
ncbi:hypothetical protein FAZ19_07315 [Sphingobacterium alkalisoli]|uniref:Uncharacterized protein n=2 Tax=Sphingobacterium TaxID=28453 RepID=A0A4U0NJ02_9SPHI|nr:MULTISPECIES: hypothetical protein [Sphingobacterium]TJY66720.1 hypothetical protein FAZ19_07315 [Sphingobacterium alkalisoli]TJZ49864.1 hypothetical protein FAZ15_22160 [Sphingobacterium olei]GGH14624.1 hypothetical protein GCM10011418_15690 [Sphingobacterium alkalisoli]